MQAHLDAWLLIGDPALRARHKYLHDPDIQIFDLADEWRALTGLPFVFAAWIARHHMELCEREELGDLLSLARDRGLRQIPQLAREAEAGDLAPEEIEDYLQNAIHYTLSDRHRAAVELFRAKCKAHGLI
jgi:chorismate dehydratase